MSKAFRETASGIAIAVGLLVAGYFLGAFLNHPPTKNSDWPAWVQAIGSIGAIFVAVAVSYYQYTTTRQLTATKEQQETEAMLQGLRDEIDVIREGFQLNVGAELEKSADGEIFNRRRYPADRPFVVYDACAGQLGKIPDAQLRRNVIRTYTQARGLSLSIRTNTHLLEELMSANIRWNFTKTEFDKRVVDDLRTSLIDYGSKLRQGYQGTRESIETLNKAVDEFLNKSHGR
ncbi:hypothetical protein [Collimonas antrihumi]|uniref:hypothetical protein n=1 Tax=Collimonas antrihumi TaxID=1940615 RepID=UPI001B8B0F2B|nr:hypothetical protein [Collimonas antrihumi]